MYKEYLVYYDCQYILVEQIYEFLKLIGIYLDATSFIEEYEEKLFPDDSQDEKIYIFLNEKTQELLYIDTYIHPSDTLGMYGIGFRCKKENFSRIFEAFKLVFERYNERDAIHTELKDNCLYNICQREYLNEDEVPGVYRLKPVAVEMVLK
ncbi:hypothetical protein J2Z32_002075 [Paenibacillus turicensis]|uniref:Uncharacterized protein n=1 Tax=Paenibacillus turicensis TaxID=160487 RepID=A0ABS4FS95_9BACL|nr:hypothetical protein [Paenibacillus turicensis]MBP1905445.1 hypothetical protein [Paenibacillus turicensis]